MNIGNQVKITSAHSLLETGINMDNAQKYHRKIDIEISLLQHGLGFENTLSDKVEIEQVIGLLERKREAIEKILIKK